MRTEVLRIVEAAAEQLEGRAFKGYYVERRLVGVGADTRHPQYYAAIFLPPSEDEIVTDLKVFTDEIKTKYPRIGTSFEMGPPPCLLAQLNTAPLGCYWFLIKSISLESDQIVFDLHVLRYFPNKTFPTAKSSNSSKLLSDPNVNFELPKLNVELAVNIIRFLSVVVAASIVGAFKAVEFLGNFTLRFLHETSFFIEKSTPMFYSSLNFLGRFVSAVLAFFTMIIRGNQPIRVKNFTPVEYVPDPYKRSNSYRRNHRDHHFD